jgi:hypothetical protein
MLESNIKKLTEAVDRLTMVMNAMCEADERSAGSQASVAPPEPVRDQNEPGPEPATEPEPQEKETNVTDIVDAGTDSLLAQCKALAKEKMDAGVSRTRIRGIITSLDASGLADLDAKGLKSFQDNLSKEVA